MLNEKSDIQNEARAKLITFSPMDFPWILEYSTRYCIFLKCKFLCDKQETWLFCIFFIMAVQLDRQRSMMMPVLFLPSFVILSQE